MIQLLSNLHLFEKNGEYAYFENKTFSLGTVNQFTYQVIKSLQKGVSPTDVAKQYNIAIQDVNTLLSRYSSSRGVEILAKENNKVKHVSRITLHISNDCNLRCKYCYASGGNYNMKRSLMTVETAKRFIEFCIHTFDWIDNIVFFGGEPFLNPQIIKFVCEEFTRLHKEGIIAYCPQFGAITNGTLVSEKAFDLIEKYFSFITVSIDGPQAINDLNRIDRFGKGTFEQIKNFIVKAKSLPNLLLRYEATFTRQHLELGYTHPMLKKFFKSEFDLDGDVVNEHSLEQEQMYSISMDKPKNIDEEYDSTFWSILSTIVEKSPKSMCPLASRILAISVDGDIFPCHMNTGEANCSLGNIFGGNIFNNREEFTQKQPGLYNKFKDNSVCNKCWSNKICGGCSRLWFYDEETHVYNIYPKKILCRSNNRYLEEKLFQIIHLWKNPKKWNEFVSELKKNNI